MKHFISSRFFSSLGTVDVYQNTLNFFDKAANLTKIEPNVLEIIRENANVLKINFPVKMEPDPLNKNKPLTQTFVGYRAQNSLHFLPTMGGLMITPDSTTNKVLAHASLNTLQAAALSIQVGGAKGAIRADPSKLLKSELENLIRRYTREIITRGYCNPSFDVLGPGDGVSTQEISWIYDTYEFYKGQKDVNFAACVVGKNEHDFGLEGSHEAAGRGIYIQTNNALKDPWFYSQNAQITPGLQDKTFIISGLTRNGFLAAQWLVEHGNAKCIGMFENEDGIYSENGIDIQHAERFYKNRKNFKDFPDCEYIKDYNNIVAKQCDIFIPADKVLALNKDNVSSINCKMIVEGYDGAISFEASEFLKNKKIPVVPDLLATGGGMVVSYFEWLQNLSHQKLGSMTKQWEKKSNLVFAQQIIEEIFKKEMKPDFVVKGASQLDLVRSASEDMLTDAYQKISGKAQSLNTDLRSAAIYEAVTKISKIYDIFGLTN